MITPRPRLPTTMRSAKVRSATSTMTLAVRPTRTVASVVTVGEARLAAIDPTSARTASTARSCSPGTRSALSDIGIPTRSSAGSMTRTTSMWDGSGQGRPATSARAVSAAADPSWASGSA